MSLAGRVSREVVTKLHTAYALTNAGIIRPQRPDRAARMALALLRWGPTPAAGVGPQRSSASAMRAARSGRCGRMIPAFARA